ncbi:hypothetical protein KAFR_0L01380 [Kazachstania africana CBS 2517]|uniref:GH16 domain-containing protein n=1 Tax=Kazachstania africana (strain ATCC 22294 / BCRC 22015 / CBS 2517 / CECT 1963 / NBRC 1671 / NRRL Y-8276) TaxID=1071382 RepID=H2B297_KAZAF|nr:hypothetical protein KAFR_0L01380 [Kazachstania africana CBS 2517]CCF60747.1 hypothetical protein KAFR_0L01380 [Kazachstania africana CBS 2517]
MLKLIFILSLWCAKFSKAELYKPDQPLKCSQASHCPREWPCCSPYGECGSGPVCVGGCNPKFSFSPRSCIPMPLLTYPFEVVQHGKEPIYEAEEDDDEETFSSFDGEHMEKNNNQFGMATSERYAMDNDINFDEPHSNNKMTDMKLNAARFIHHSNFLVTPSNTVAETMVDKFDFTYSGHANVDDTTKDILLTMPKRTTGTLIASTKEFLYGKIGLNMKTARSQGVVTAIVIISQVGDEIDYEFLGGDLFNVQTNYYYQGELDYTKMVHLPLTGNTFDNYHRYEIDWDEEKISWIIDGEIRRTLFKKDTWDGQRYRYPQTPSRLEVAVWPGGADTNHPGTIQWAGGLIDWENSPDILEKGQFYAQINEIKITPHQNKYFDTIMSVLETCVGNPDQVVIKDFQKLTVGYDEKKGPQFNEDSLSWYCDIIPKVDNWRDSGETILEV